jgi:hypothetical protein
MKQIEEIVRMEKLVLKWCEQTGRDLRYYPTMVEFLRWFEQVGFKSSLIPKTTNEGKDLLTNAGNYAAEAEKQLGADVHPKTASFNGFIEGAKWMRDKSALSSVSSESNVGGMYDKELTI